MSRHFNKTEDLGMWIEAHVEGKDDYVSVMTAVYWFIASQEALFILNACDTKDITAMLLDGTQKINGSQEYVDNYLDTCYDDLNEEGIEEANELLITNLKTHFGL